MKANLIVPRQLQGGPEEYQQLRAEYSEHLHRAQDLYERALQAHVTGASNRDLLFRQAMIEQNAALLCQGELNRAALALAIAILCDLTGDEDEAPLGRPAGGIMQ